MALRPATPLSCTLNSGYIDVLSVTHTVSAFRVSKPSISSTLSHLAAHNLGHAIYLSVLRESSLPSEPLP